MQKSECILVTGGHGFIGSELLQLIENDLPIVVVDNLNKLVHPDLNKLKIGAKADTYFGDISNLELWGQIFSKYKPRVIIHLAAETSTGLSGSQINIHTRTNVNGLAVLLTALNNHNILPEQFILASSRAVYGEGIWSDEFGKQHSAARRTVIDLEKSIYTPRSIANPDIILNKPLGQNWSTTPKNPTSVYGLTKSFQEDLIEIWARERSVNLAILRLQNVYGPGQTPSNSYTGILGIFLRSAMFGEPVCVYEEGNIIRDFVFVSDVANAIYMVLKSNPKYVKADVGTGRQLSLFAIADQITSFYSRPKPLVVKEFRVGDVRATYSDQLGWLPDWKPKVTFEEGLLKTIDYVEEFFQYKK